MITLIRRRRFAFALGAGAVALLMLSLNRAAALPPTTFAPYPDNATLSPVGIQLSPALAADVAAVGREDALKIAIADAGPLGDPSKPYSIQLTRITDLNYGEDGKPLIINSRLVWLVRFTGTPQPVFGPFREAGQPTARPATELNVVVDAATGAVLESFSFQ